MATLQPIGFCSELNLNSTRNNVRIVIMIITIITSLPSFSENIISNQHLLCGSPWRSLGVQDERIGAEFRDARFVDMKCIPIS